MAKAAEAGVDIVTVYRTLNLFMKLSLVQEIGYGRNRMLELSDGYVAHHHHFWCRQCGKLTDFDDAAVELALTKAIEGSGGTMISHHVEISGICSSCRDTKDHKAA